MSGPLPAAIAGILGHPAAPLLPALLLALLIGARRPSEPWSTAVDLPLLLGSALGLTLLCDRWLVRFVLESSSIASDFGEYCEAVAELRGAPEALPAMNRSRALAWVVAVLAEPLGTIGGLRAAALLGLTLTAALVGLCGRLLHSRLAGLCAVAFVGTLTPLTLLSRTYTFYPLLTAAFAAAATGACLLARTSHPLAYAAAGLGAGLALLADLRGLLFALPVIGFGALSLLRRPAAHAPLRALGMALPLIWSFQVGPWAYPARHAAPLEKQADVQTFALILGHSPQDARRLVSADSAFLWGTSDLRELPATLQYLRRFSALGPGSAERAREHAEGYARRVAPFAPLIALSAAITALSLVRRPWALLGLLAALAPWAANLRGAVTTQASDWRFLAVGAPGAALLLGVGFAATTFALPRGRGARRPAALGATALGAAATLALVLGAWPSPLGPRSPWRLERILGDSQVDAFLLGSTDPRWPGCAAAIARDRARGLLPARSAGGRHP